MMNDLVAEVAFPAAGEECCRGLRQRGEEEGEREEGGWEEEEGTEEASAVA